MTNTKKQQKQGARGSAGQRTARGCPIHHCDRARHSPNQPSPALSVNVFVIMMTRPVESFAAFQ